MRERVQPAPELGVGECVDHLSCIRTARKPALRVADHRSACRLHCERRRGQCPVAERLGGGERAAGPAVHPLEVGLEEPVDRELDHQPDRDRTCVLELREGLLEPELRLGVSPEQVLYLGALGGHPHA